MTPRPAVRRSWKVPCESSELVPSESFDKSKRGVNSHLLYSNSTSVHTNNHELLCVRLAFSGLEYSEVGERHPHWMPLRLGVARQIEIRLQTGQRTPVVQQPCSNPSKSPERLGNESTQKYVDLQQFCKLWKRLENDLAALAWRRPGVQVPSGPLEKVVILQAK